MAKSLGKPLMPHQRYIADVSMEIDPVTGLLVYEDLVIVGPRQASGKSEYLLDLMTTRCTAFRHYGPQNVIYVAQTADEARKKWRRLHMLRLQKSRRFRHMFEPALTTNKEAFYWNNGSIWSPGSSTGKTSATGDTCDCGVVDEAWAHPTGRTELGMRPTMMTRLSTQFVLASMVPGINRVLPGQWKYLADKMKAGRAMVEGDHRQDTCYIEFSAPEDMDSSDPRTWRKALPGLGFTTTEDKIRKAYNKALEIENGLIDFEAELLGWAPKAARPMWTFVSEATWEDRRRPESTLEGGPAIALVVDDDRLNGVIGTAGRSHLDPGLVHIEVVEPGGGGPDGIPADVQGVDWMLPRVLKMIAKLVAEQTPPSCVVVDPRRQEASLIEDLRQALTKWSIPLETPSMLDCNAACGLFYDATGQVSAVDDADATVVRDATRLVHIGQVELYNAIRVAQKLDSGSGGFTIVKRGSESVLIHPYSCVLAMLGHRKYGHIKRVRSKVY